MMSETEQHLTVGKCPDRSIYAKVGADNIREVIEKFGSTTPKRSFLTEMTTVEVKAGACSFGQQLIQARRSWSNGGFYEQRQKV